MRISSRTLPSIVLLLMSLLLAACGTLEVAMEPSAAPDADVTSTNTRENASAPSGVVQRMMTPTPVPRPITVAFVNEGDVWSWTGNQSEATPLTTGGDINESSVKISDDGNIIAFTRRYELWMVRADGSDERILVSEADLDAMEPIDPGVWINRYDWMPDSHRLAFTTILREPYGSTFTDDLHLVDAETLEHTTLLPPGQGGHFYYSPDGSQIALVTPGTISLIDADGSNRRDDILTYTPSQTAAELRYHAEPIWAADGSFLRVPILPADVWADPPQPTSIWHLPIDGTSGHLIASLDVRPEQRLAFAPDLSYVAYLEPFEDDPSGMDATNLLLTDLASGETMIYRQEDAIRVLDWSPAGQQFAFITLETEPESLKGYTGTPGTEPLPIDTTADLWIMDLRWVDGYRYLLQAVNLADGSWNLLQGAIGTPSDLFATIPETPGGDVPPFDFAVQTGPGS